MLLDISYEIGITIFANQRGRRSVDVRVSIVSGNQSDELESLDDWLQAEPALSGKTRLSKPVPQQGDLGSLADALVVSVGAGGALSVLAGSVRAWLSQPRRANGRIRLRGEGGRTGGISAGRNDAENIGTLRGAAMRSR